MTKVAFLNDLHFGAKSDHILFQKYISDFFHKQFWPFIDQNQIKHVMVLGDLMDRRKYANYMTLWTLNYALMNEIEKRPDVEFGFLPGNHDMFFKEGAPHINALTLLLGHRKLKNVRLFTEPTACMFAGRAVHVFPWITEEGLPAALSLIDDADGDVAFGHFEFAGFEMQKGSMMHEGMDASLFKGYDKVISGHYHEKSSRGNVEYLGVQYPLTWADFETPKGFHVLDMDTLELEHIVNPVSIFRQIHFDGNRPLAENLQELEDAKIKDRIVKVLVTNRTSLEDYERYMTAVESKNAFQLQTVEDRNLDVSDLDVSASEDTLDILLKYVETTEFKHKDPLVGFLSSLYNEAMALQIAE